MWEFSPLWLCRSWEDSQCPMLAPIKGRVSVLAPSARLWARARGWRGQATCWWVRTNGLRPACPLPTWL